MSKKLLCKFSQESKSVLFLVFTGMVTAITIIIAIRRDDKYFFPAVDHTNL
jgi:hypothetical protein